MTHKIIEENYKKQLENIIKPLLKDFPKHKDIFDLFGDHISATRLSQAVQLYTKIAKLNKDLEEENKDMRDDAKIREDLIIKVQKLIHPS